MVGKTISPYKSLRDKFGSNYSSTNLFRPPQVEPPSLAVGGTTSGLIENRFQSAAHSG